VELTSEARHVDREGSERQEYDANAYQQWLRRSFHGA
jgi:hypothetical protein